jgi:prepilin-type N-terminal cleavage/methylation domain-containing protein
MTKNQNHKAFSLIEISMVILVIGILIAGISNGVDLYDDYRLKVAQNLTKNSRVNRIPDLELWFETTGENSLATGTANFTDKPNPADLDRIGRWNDVNPNILPSARNHATQTNDAKQPQYIRKGMNGLPALKFDGTDDFFSFNGNFLVGSDYTIFVVEARGSNKYTHFFLGGAGFNVNSRLHVGYRRNNTITLAHFFRDLDKIVPNFASQVGAAHSFIFSKVNGKAIWTNGGGKVFNQEDSAKEPLISYVNSVIAGNNEADTYFIGNIAEIIFYSRALTDQERQGVETYLSKKWGIKLG